MSDEINIVKTKRSNSQQENQLIYKVILGIVLLIIVGGASFYAGVSYQKGHSTSSSSTTATGQGFGGGGGFRGRFGNRTIGTVSAISSSSITVQPQSGSAKTFTINSSTVISDNGSTVSYSSIQTGTNVFVIASSASSNVATRILVNPSFGGFGGGGQQNPSGSSTNGSGTSATGGSSTGSNTSLN